MNDNLIQRVKPDLTDAITDEIEELACQLVTAGRRLSDSCDPPPDYLVILSLTRGVAASAANVAARLQEQADHLDLRLKFGDDHDFDDDEGQGKGA